MSTQKINLIKLLNAADHVTCNGYEIDDFHPVYSQDAKTGKVWLTSWGDDVVTLPIETEVEISEDGTTKPVIHEGVPCQFEFFVRVPLLPSTLDPET